MIFKKKNRGKLDDTMCAMFSNMNYRENYLFYAHLIGQTSIVISKNLPAPAGVLFNMDHYELHIRPESQWIPWDQAVKMIDPNFIDKIEKDDLRTSNGVDEFRIIKGFDDFPLIERLAILKHEMLHILYGHVLPKNKATRILEEGHHREKNLAYDCALNQQIDPSHLPKSCIIPKTLAIMLKIATVPENESSEFYYELIKQNTPEQDKSNQSGDSGDGSDGEGQGQGQGEGSGDSKGNGKMQPGMPGNIDSHDLWDQSTGDPDLNKDITKKMIEKSQNETIKNKGTVPNSCSEWLTLHSRKSEVNWKKVLRGIVGNKRVGSRSTIMRNDRRFPKRGDLRGKTKDRMFNLLAIGDVSGSMSDEAILDTAGEVKHICDITKTGLTFIQVDTVAYPPEELTKSTKIMERKGNGGTYLNTALEMAKKHKIDYQAVVVLTDGGLFGDDIDIFKALNKKVIWLIEPNGYIMDEMNSGKMQAFKLKDKSKKNK